MTTLSPLYLFCATGLYAAFLFYVAWRGDKIYAGKRTRSMRTLVYALSIGVYCTSWTYFGAVGSAAIQGWAYLAIYLGPFLVLVFGAPVVKRLITVCKQENIISVSDFIGARFGRSRSLAALATVFAVAGTVPYIALQLRSVATSFGTAIGDEGVARSNLVVFGVAAILGVFAVLFGARNTDISRPNRGLIDAIAVESLVKLVALGLVAVLASGLLMFNPEPTIAFADVFNASSFDDTFVTSTLLAMSAILLLPRQFHVIVVEPADASLFPAARWVFAVYLVLISAFVIPITLAGLSALPVGSSPDVFVLALPLIQGDSLMATLVFLGGFSAATGMVVIVTIALSGMITNDIIVPLVYRVGGSSRKAATTNSAMRFLLASRRILIFVLMLLASLYYVLVPDTELLSQIGLLSFAACAQFAPLVLAGLYWPRANRVGAIFALLTGFGLWFTFLVLPAFGQSFAVLDVVSQETGLAKLTLGVALSLTANVLVLVIGSTLFGQAALERSQAANFTMHGPWQRAVGSTRTDSRARIGDLEQLAVRFLGQEAASAAFERFRSEVGLPLLHDDPVDGQIARRTERLLSGAIGSASSRILVANTLLDASFSIEDVVHLLDETNQELQFSRELLDSALSHITQGVSVVDAQHRLVAWNDAYARLFQYPEGFLRPGMPLEQVIRLNAHRGWCGPGEVEDHVRKRMEHLRSRLPHTFERTRPSGMVIRSFGAPMKGGGYVSTYTDITEDRQRALALEEANLRLEERVRARTLELERLNSALSAAKRAADKANDSKTRFLAAASHDLLQPLNAARLFSAALAEDLKSNPEQSELIINVDRSIRSADRLLRSLLDISKLDQGGVTARIETFQLSDILSDIEREFLAIASGKGLRFRVRGGHLAVTSDKVLLRSIIQNFLSNAVRYTRKGGVLLAARRRDGHVRIEIWDTGIGIQKDKLTEIFKEFQRIGASELDDDRGVGLGLAIVERAAVLIGADIIVKSEPGRGSMFAISIRSGDAGAIRQTASAPPSTRQTVFPKTVLVVDDEPSIRTAMKALLSRLGCEVHLAGSLEEAIRMGEQINSLDAVVADYHLGNDQTGLAVLDRLKSVRKQTFRGALLTADTGDWIRAQARQRGLVVLRKPIDPARLKTWLSQTVSSDDED
jgi:Na+/proline symporter/signal transduction histidine kinase